MTRTRLAAEGSPDWRRDTRQPTPELTNVRGGVLAVPPLGRPALEQSDERGCAEDTPAL